MNPSTIVNISASRYIELLENEIKMLKSTAFIETALPKPQVLPDRTSNCNLSDVTKAIQASGISVRTWADRNGFNYDMVRKVACRLVSHRAIEAQLKEDGFLEG